MCLLIYVSKFLMFNCIRGTKNATQKASNYNQWASFILDFVLSILKVKNLVKLF